MTTEITKLDSPIDVMYLLHKALRAEAGRVEQSVDQLDLGGSLQPFEQAFNRWVMALGYHADMEDRYMTAPLSDAPPARDNETTHRRLVEMLDDFQTYLRALGQTGINARTRRHLFGRVVTLRIAQDDHFEEEEEFVLPVIRQRIGEEQQLEMARRLLVDQEAADERWILDRVAREVTATERRWLADLEARFAEVLPRPR